LINLEEKQGGMKSQDSIYGIEQLNAMLQKLRSIIRCATKIREGQSDLYPNLDVKRRKFPANIAGHKADSPQW
jgi:hypothetical protein